jgi:hypothetical protein
MRASKPSTADNSISMVRSALALRGLSELMLSSVDDMKLVKPALEQALR